ncbi:cytochrome c oxidase biogenesis protein Cmc1-like protein [Pseudohyphozyma bogoriensis]|nr:cytochrome c oxidase biogenesis protein Cmc1-like protein [Pseudohyphozyma bogoriensis]
MLNAEHSHERCAEVMRALKDCHANNPYLKFFGLCNDEKHNLNMCFRAERLERTKENREKALEKRKQIEAKWKAIDEE